MMKNSFTFGGVDIRKTYGIVISETHDVLLPPLRERKVVIPGRDGAYDYGAKNYDERILSFDCNITREISRAQIREISYFFSRKSRIEVWNEPGKYYIGRIYNSEEIQRVGTTQKHFILQFTCDPFAYGEVKTKSLNSGENLVQYLGTASTPTLIVLKNTGNDPINNVIVTAIFKR